MEKRLAHRQPETFQVCSLGQFSNPTGLEKIMEKKHSLL